MAKRVDLTDRKFGRWTVLGQAESRHRNIYWLCQCECGTKRNVQGTALKNGTSASCGCLHNELAADKFLQDLTGHRNGKIEVVSFNRKEINKSGSRNEYYWNVKCDCGNTKVMSSSSVRSSRSCGCGIIEAQIKRLFVDLTGKKFGKLTVLKFDSFREQKTRNGQRSSYWLCKCDCGNEKIVKINSLQSGSTTTCGCSIEDRKKPDGISKHKFYRHWISMHQRCYNKNDKSYYVTGARGIKVCERWRSERLISSGKQTSDSDHEAKFWNFVKDIEKGWKPDRFLFLCRSDSNKDFEPENIEWGYASKQVSSKTLIERTLTQHTSISATTEF